MEIFHERKSMEQKKKHINLTMARFLASTWSDYYVYTFLFSDLKVIFQTPQINFT